MALSTGYKLTWTYFPMVTVCWVVKCGVDGEVGKESYLFTSFYVLGQSRNWYAIVHLNGSPFIEVGPR